MHKNKSVSEEHIDHCLQVFVTYSALNKQTKGAFVIKAKYELVDIEFFMRPSPDLYLYRKKPEEEKQLDYTLNIFDANLPFWVMKKRVRAYQTHCDETESWKMAGVILAYCY